MFVNVSNSVAVSAVSTSGSGRAQVRSSGRIIIDSSGRLRVD